MRGHMSDFTERVHPMDITVPMFAGRQQQRNSGRKKKTLRRTPGTMKDEKTILCKRDSRSYARKSKGIF